MIYQNIEELLRIAEEKKLSIWEAVLEAESAESAQPKEEAYRRMAQMLEAMREADKNYDGGLRSASGMAGGDGAKLAEYNKNGRSLCGDFCGLAMEKAVKMGESNACMRRIVAAPTAGSCGVIPAVLLAYAECFSCGEDELVRALFVAAGIGSIIDRNAYIAGAAGGCQAEIGTAAAMAAAALAFLEKGDNEAVVHAAALALKNMLGLVCDPVCGLVEVPCIKRNSYGAVNAISSAQLALAGIRSVITPDDVIDTMRRIGNELPPCLKETAEGGLAVSESALKIKMQKNL